MLDIMRASVQDYLERIQLALPEDSNVKMSSCTVCPCGGLGCASGCSAGCSSGCQSGSCMTGNQ